MATNNIEIEINAPIEKVWFALTNSNEFSKWMNNVKVQTDWEKGSEITYTCFDESGKVLQWDGMDMIWKGLIKTIDKNKQLTCIYPSKTTGLEQESYLLEKVDDQKTKLIQNQLLISQEVADRYAEGLSQTLDLLKVYLENDKS